jgi:hypothetical protein
MSNMIFILTPTKLKRKINFVALRINKKSDLTLIEINVICEVPFYFIYIWTFGFKAIKVTFLRQLRYLF